MIVGDYISEELGELFFKEKRIKDQYKNYCKYHGKILKTQYAVQDGPLFILQIIILDKNGNNGEIKNC